MSPDLDHRGRVLRRCALVFGLVSAGTIGVLIAQWAFGVRSLGDVVVYSVSTVVGGLIGATVVYAGYRFWASSARRRS